MTLDRKDYKSAIPQLESRLAKIEKLGKDVFNKFEDIAHKTQLDAEEVEKKVLALDYQMDTLKVVTEYAIVPTGYDPDDWSGTTWDTTMPNLDADSFAPTVQYPNGFTLWARSKTYRNDIVVQYTDPQPVELMDGVFTFVNTIASDAGWTTINGDTITTGKITSADGKCYFDLSNSNFQLKNAADLADATSALAWNGSSGTLYVKGELAVGSPVGNTTLGGIRSTANTANSNANTALSNASDALSKANQVYPYMTYVDSTYGVRVYRGDKANADNRKYYSQVNSDGLDVVVNDKNVSHFGAVPRVGSEDDFNITINPSYGSGGVAGIDYRFGQTTYGSTYLNIQHPIEGSTVPYLTHSVGTSGVLTIRTPTNELSLADGRRNAEYIRWDTETDDYEAGISVWSFGGTGRVALLVGSGGENHGVFSLTHDKWIIYADKNAKIHIPQAADSTTKALYITSGGILQTTSSSRKVKKDIDNIKDESLDPSRLYDLRVAQFRYKDTETWGDELVSGFIAEEVLDVYPSAACKDGNGGATDWEARNIIPPMLKLIQEQKKQIDELTERVEKLEKPNV